MIKTASCTSVQTNGNVTTKYGVKNSYEIAFDNGDCGNHLADGNSKFEKGKSYAYELIVNGKYTNIKFIALNDNQSSASSPVSTTASTQQSKPAYSGKSPEESNRIARMNALTNAINFCNGTNKSFDLLDVLAVAQDFERFICDGVNSTLVAQQYNKINAGIKEDSFVQNFKEEALRVMENQQDDLPF